MISYRDLTDRKLKELYYNNISYREISEKYNCSIPCVAKRVNKLIEDEYIIKRPNINKLVLTDQDLEYYESMDLNKDLNGKKISKNEIISLYLNGLERKEISTFLGCSYRTVVSIIHEYNTKGVGYSLGYSNDIIEYILELYSNYVAITLISKICNISCVTINKIIENAIRCKKIEKRKIRQSRINNNTLQIIDMYRSHYSISVIADKLNKSYKEVDLLIENMIKNGRVKKRDPKNKYKNLLTMRLDKNRVLTMYQNNVSIENIADYYQVSTKQIKTLIESLGDIEMENTLYKMIFINKKKPKEIELELGIPPYVIYKYLNQKNIC